MSSMAGIRRERMLLLRNASRHDGLKLGEIGEVVHDGKRLASVQEADRRSVAGRPHRRLGNAVEPGRGGREAAVRHI